MPTFKTYMKILLAHRIYIVIYLVIISITGIAIGLSTASGSSQHFTATSSIWSGAAGFLVALIAAYREKKLLTVALLACAAVFLVERILNLIPLLSI